MKFGKYAILTNSRYTLKREPEWWWEFRPTTSRDELDMLRWLEENQQNATWIDIAWEELARSFGGTNIPGDDGKPILNPGDPRDKVYSVLQSMPIELVGELWKALGEAHPLWGPKFQPKQEEQQD